MRTKKEIEERIKLLMRKPAGHKDCEYDYGEILGLKWVLGEEARD